MKKMFEAVIFHSTCPQWADGQDILPQVNLSAQAVASWLRLCAEITARLVAPGSPPPEIEDEWAVLAPEGERERLVILARIGNRYISLFVPDAHWAWAAEV